MKTAGLVALFVLAFASSVSARTALTTAISDNSDYPTYDLANAQRKADDCYSLFVGRNGDRIPANADKDEIVSGFHNCLAAGGLRYSTSTAEALNDGISELATAKAELIVDIGKRLNKLLALDISVDNAEGSVEEGFVAADLDSLATPLDAQDSVLKRGGQRAEEAEASLNSAESLMTLLTGIEGGDFSDDADEVEDAQDAVSVASTTLATRKAELEALWSDPASGARKVILDNYNEVSDSSTESRQAISISGEGCYVNADCDAIDCHGETVKKADDATWDPNTDSEFDIDYTKSSQGTCAALASEPTHGAGSNECDTDETMFKLSDLDIFASRLVGKTVADYAAYAGKMVLAAGGFVSNPGGDYCAKSNTNLGRIAQIADGSNAAAGMAGAASDVANALFEEGGANEDNYECTAEGIVTAKANKAIGEWKDDLDAAFKAIAWAISGVEPTEQVLSTLSADGGRINNEGAVLTSLLQDFKSTDSNGTNPELMAFKRAVLAESIHELVENVDDEIKDRCTVIIAAQGGGAALNALNAARGVAETQAQAVQDGIHAEVANAACSTGASDPSVFSLVGLALSNDAACASAQLEELAEAVDNAIDTAYTNAMSAYCTAAKACKDDEQCTLDAGEHSVYQGFVDATKTVDSWDESVSGYTNVNRLDDVTSNDDFLAQC